MVPTLHKALFFIILAAATMNVLLVEDDPELARQLLAELTADEHTVQVETEGLGGLKAALDLNWDVAIMDVSLPSMSGFEIVEQMRSEKVNTPVIFLTARGDVNNRVHGLSIGGDDYLTKPFSMDELKARLLALTRRHANNSAVGPALPKGWTLDPLLREVTVHGRKEALQPREWSLLELFLNHEGEVLTNSFLLEQVWGIHFDPGTNVVSSTICRLRKKLDQKGKASCVETLRGRGHVFHRHD